MCPQQCQWMCVTRAVQVVNNINYDLFSTYTTIKWLARYVVCVFKRHTTVRVTKYAELHSLVNL